MWYLSEKQYLIIIALITIGRSSVGADNKCDKPPVKEVLQDYA